MAGSRMVAAASVTSPTPGPRIVFLRIALGIRTYVSSVAPVLPQVMDIGGGVAAPGAPGIGAAQVCTLCVKHDMAAAGGFGGELVVKRLDALDAFAFRCGPGSGRGRAGSWARGRL